MRIQIASDLHLDALQARFPHSALIEAAAGADVLVLAGDIHLGTHAVEIFSDWPVPVVYVNGNHEAYGSEYGPLVAAIAQRSAGTRVHYLERRSIVFGKVRFLGCCLWTDYELYGDLACSMAYAREVNADHAAIRTQGSQLFGPEEALAEHRRAVAWLEEELAKPFDGKTVVVTHHGVSPDSIHPRFRDHPVNPGFLSDLRYLLPRADLWIHGHVHDSFDYRHGAARVVTNPRGYPRNLAAAQGEQQLEWENALFDPACVVEL